MLEWLVKHRKLPTGRKLRLFAVACCRCPAVSRLLSGRQTRALIEAVERLAEGDGSSADVAWCVAAAPQGGAGGRISNAELVALALASEGAWEAAWSVVREWVNLLGQAGCD